MRQRVVTLVHANLSVAAVRAGVGQHEGGNPGDISLERKNHHVAHQADVILVTARNPFRFLKAGEDVWAQGAFTLGTLDTLLDLANRSEVFVQFHAVVAADFS